LLKYSTGAELATCFRFERKPQEIKFVTNVDQMANTIDQELNKYLVKMSEAEKKSVLQMIKTFLEGRKTAFEHISIEQYNRELEDAEKGIEAGRFTTQEDLENEIEKW
jgi:predicted CopG family antitoxin